MKLDIKVTQQDFLRATFYFHYSKPVMNIIRIVVFIMLLAVIYISINNPEIPRTRDMVIIFFCVGYIYIAVPLIVYYRAKKTYRTIKNIDLPITYEFTDSKIELTSGELHSTIPWDNVYKVGESKSLFYIYQSKGIANLLPKRFFTDDQIAGFRELVKKSGVKYKFRKTVR